MVRVGPLEHLAWNDPQRGGKSMQSQNFCEGLSENWKKLKWLPGALRLLFLTVCLQYMVGYSEVHLKRGYSIRNLIDGGGGSSNVHRSGD